MKKLLTLILSMFVTLSVSAQTVAVFDFDCDDFAFYDKVSTMTDLCVINLFKMEMLLW